MTTFEQAQPIEQPGQTLEKSLAELLDVHEESDIVIEWGEQIRGIEKSERTALASVTNLRTDTHAAQELTGQRDLARSVAVKLESECAELQHLVATAAAYLEALKCGCEAPFFLCDRCQALGILRGDNAS